MKRYLFFVKKDIAVQVLADLIGTTALALAPLLQEWLFDGGYRQPAGVIFRMLCLYFFLLFVYAVMQYVCNLTAFRASIRFENKMKKDFFGAVFSMKNDAFEQTSVGEYISVQGNDITAVSNDYLTPFVDVLRSANVLVIYGVVLFFWVDARVALVIILSSLTAIALPRLFGRALNAARSAYQQSMADYVEKITDLLEGFSTINSRNRKNVNDYHENALDGTAKMRYAYGKKKCLVLGAGELSTKIVRGVTFAAVAVLLYRGEITIGTGIATLSYISSFIEPIDNLLYDVTTMQAMKRVMEKIMRYLDWENVCSPPAPPMGKSVKLCGVSIARGDFHMENIHMEFEKGKKYAITGKNGCGKSTLLKAVAGQIPIAAGTIRMDGVDLSGYDTSRLIAYTAQNEHIYRAGLRENISMFGAYPTDRLPQIPLAMANRVLGNRGVSDCQTFSGGEKQIVALLRALAQDTEILLLDEPFSAVDAAAREKLYHFLLTDRCFADKTILMVTHDTSEETLRGFDRVIHM